MNAVKQMFEVNVFGQMAITQAVLPMLVAAQGRVINIGSVAERAPAPWESGYSVTKAAMAMLSRCMRVEFAPLGVKVIHVRRFLHSFRPTTHSYNPGSDRRC
jgi:1-acylglycerone phosphate reductase